MALNAATMEVSQQLDMSPEKSANESNLQEALVDFSEIMEEVEEEGYPTPSKIAFKNAKRLLLEIYKICPLRYYVFPSSEGEINIGAQTRPKHRFLLACDSDGNVHCISTVNGKMRDKFYTDAKLLPDDFIHEALRKLV